MSTENTYKVTALKWRPKQFKDVVYQSHVTITLTNAIKSGRIAHAYLFCGPRGVGKTTIARIFSRAVNCLNPKDGEPCDECENCKIALEGRGLDIVEIDGASNRGIDDMRNLQESTRYTPTKGKYKVFIIDEIHMITREGFNAFLKTLEEPPEHIIFIGATTEPIKVFPTIISRCQRFDFRRIPVADIIERLKYISEQENIKIDEESLLTIAKKGDGSLRDAQSIFDQVISSCGNDVRFENLAQIMNLVSMDIYFKITDFIKQKNTQSGLSLIDEIAKQGYDLHEFLLGLLDHFRNLLITVVTKSADELEVSEEFKKKYAENITHFTEGDVLRIMKLLSELEINYKYFNQPRLRFEITLLQIIKMHKTIEIETLLNEFEELKKKLINPIDISNEKILFKVQKEVETPKEIKYNEERSSLSEFKIKPEIKSTPLNQPIPTKQPPPPINGRKSDLTMNEIQSKWSILLDEVLKSNKIFIKTILASAQLIDFDGISLTMNLSSGIEVDAINNNKIILGDIFETVFGERFNLICEFNGKNQKQNSNGNSNTLEKDHPVVKLLIKEFGAEPVI